ncbi:MAG: hypothetical protein BGO54_00405 [Sphingobacteriales bacterium 46-32]|nr:MAG: hypothetical protein BGO54_00405 [Sphingobacteriales bacterium 46-32]
MAKFQKHRIKALRANLDRLKVAAITKTTFVETYRDVYRFPKKLTDRNIRDYKQLIKAIEKIQSFDLEVFR